MDQRGLDHDSSTDVRSTSRAGEAGCLGDDLGEKVSEEKKHLKCNLMKEAGKAQAETGERQVGQESLQ